MQGIGTVAIVGPRFEEFLGSRKDFFEVSQGGLARILLLGCTAGLIFLSATDFAKVTFGPRSSPPHTKSSFCFS